MHTLAFMGMPGQTEVLLIVFVILLLFGAKKLPELSRSLGKSLGEFKKGQREGTEPDKDAAGAEKKEIIAADEKEASAEDVKKAPVSTDD
ncbi:MAG: twin-arginine translocase TatA/TatE family subunit [Kiritimatiellales bacterium]|nr:twin-arginine translocase TatA/TatE family subunit [Kiritimatiellales bacterium]